MVAQDSVAERLIDRHGDEAPIHAAMRAVAIRAKGDLDGAAVSRRNVRTAEGRCAARPRGRV